MKRAWLVASSLSISACGATSHAMQVDEARVDEAQVEEAGALRLLTLERPMGESIALSLWIDAGTLDGPNASHALVAASIVAARANMAMRVTPDATSFRLLCTSQTLDACFDRFGEVLATREVSEDEFAAALIEVRQRRERSLADASRASLGLAVESLLGLRMQALGEAEDVITRESVSAFLRMHYGPNRALVIAVGAHEHDALHAASARVNGPLAESERATREVREGASHAIEESHLDPAWTFAQRAQNEADARAMADAWIARAGDEGEVSLFPTRLGWVATLTLHGQEPETLHRAATWMRAREPHRADTSDADAWTLSNRHGDAWSAHPEDATSRVAFAGAGRVDASLVESLYALLATRTVELTRDEHRARAVLDGATMHVVDSLGGTRGAVEVRFEGAALDGPNSGASVIAIEALQARCFEGTEVTLDGASVRITVRDEAALLAGRAAWILDCVASTRPSAHALDLAQRTRIAHVPVDAEMRAAVARLLSPQGPGWVLPEGSRTSLADTTLREVEARIDAWSQAVEVRVGWPTALSDDDVRELARAILPPRLEHATAPHTPSDTHPMEAEETRMHAEIDAPAFILAVRVDGVDMPGAGAGACAPLDAWTHERVAPPTWRAHGEASGWSWCAVALRAWPEGAGPSVDEALLRQRIAEASEAAESSRALQRSDVAGAARALLAHERSSLREHLEVTLRRAIVEPAPPPLRRR